MGCAALLLSACGSDDETPSGGAGDGAVELTVFAASSLTDAFTQIGERLRGRERRCHGDVQLRIVRGPRGPDRSRREPRTCSPRRAGATWTTWTPIPASSGRVDFVQNKLVVITPPDNPAGIQSFEDLAEPGRPDRARGRGRPGRRLRAGGARRGGHPRSPSWPTSSRTKRTTPRSSRRSRPARPTRRSPTSPTSRARSRRTSPRSRSPTT